MAELIPTLTRILEPVPSFAAKALYTAVLLFLAGLLAVEALRVWYNTVPVLTPFTKLRSAARPACVHPARPDRA